MNCASPYTTNVCTNSNGTTCVKASVTIPLISGATSCSATDLVLMSGTEYTNLYTAANRVIPALTATTTTTNVVDIPPFQIDVAGGALISSAILSVWALGFGFRALIQAIRSPFPNDDHSVIP